MSEWRPADSEGKLRCEGCHAWGPGAKLEHIHVPNGVFTVCPTCLEAVNRKNPKLIDLENENRALRRALEAVEHWSQTGINNEESFKRDASDHIRVREIALAALAAHPAAAPRCPECGHQPHEPGRCLNMASDGDCKCGAHPAAADDVEPVTGQRFVESPEWKTGPVSGRVYHKSGRVEIEKGSTGRWFVWIACVHGTGWRVAMPEIRTVGQLRRLLELMNLGGV